MASCRKQSCERRCHGEVLSMGFHMCPCWMVGVPAVIYMIDHDCDYEIVIYCDYEIVDLLVTSPR